MAVEQGKSVAGALLAIAAVAAAFWAGSWSAGPGKEPHLPVWKAGAAEPVGSSERPDETLDRLGEKYQSH